jgi:hypothetical protein
MDDTQEQGTLEAQEPQEDPGQELPEEPQRTAPNRSAERISELIRKNKALMAEVEAERHKNQSMSAPQAQDYVDERGIDPKKFTDHVLQEATVAASKQVEFKLQLVQVSQDPLMKKQSAQDRVSRLIDQGFSPAEAFEVYKAERDEIAEEIKQEKSIRDATGKFQKSQGQAPRGQESSSGGKGLTPESIRNMGTEEYAKRLPEINEYLARRSGR